MKDFVNHLLKLVIIPLITVLLNPSITLANCQMGLTKLDRAASEQPRLQDEADELGVPRGLSFKETFLEGDTFALEREVNFSTRAEDLEPFSDELIQSQVKNEQVNFSTRAEDLEPFPDELIQSQVKNEQMPLADVAQATEENEVSPPESTPATTQAEGGNLSQQAQNPIANLISIPFQNNLNFDVGPFDETQYVLNIQPVIPVELSENWLLVSRIIAPIISQPTVEVDLTTGAFERGGSEFGLGDINPSFFFVPQTNSKITWGVGPTFVLPTATEDVLGSDRWSAGPTGVIVVTQGKWLYGVLVNQVWSFAGDEDRPDVSQFLIQPFINYSLPDGWTIGSAPTITANWNADEGDKWTIPVGLTVSKVTLFGRQPVQFSLGGFYNVERPTFGADWTLRFAVTLLFPTGN